MQVELIKVNDIRRTEKHQDIQLHNNDRVFCPLLVTEPAILLKLYHIHLIKMTKMITKFVMPGGNDLKKTKTFSDPFNMF